MHKFIKNLFSSTVPNMTEESAAMISKYNKICTRKDIVDKFNSELNTQIYNRAKFGGNTLTITDIPQEVIPHIQNIVKELQDKKFKVALITDPYTVIAIKWNVAEF